MEIRYILPTDDPYKISHVYEQSWRDAYQGIVPQDYLDNLPFGCWVGNIGKDRRRHLVITENDIIIGTSCFSSSRFERYADYGEIVSLYLLPEYIGKGYGKLLLSKAIEELRRSGYDQILLWVLEDNHRARQFYEKAGFTLSGETQNDTIGGKELNEVMYVYQMG